MDVLQNHEIKILSNEANLKRIIIEMAHKEIIQVAMLVIDCWIPIVKYSGLDHASLIAVYENLVPTTRSVTKSLKFPENMGVAETICVHAPSTKLPRIQQQMGARLKLERVNIIHMYLYQIHQAKLNETFIQKVATVER